jgi:hypothetical protein
MRKCAGSVRGARCDASASGPKPAKATAPQAEACPKRASAGRGGAKARAISTTRLECHGLPGGPRSPPARSGRGARNRYLTPGQPRLSSFAFQAGGLLAAHLASRCCQSGPPSGLFPRAYSAVAGMKTLRSRSGPLGGRRRCACVAGGYPCANFEIRSKRLKRRELLNQTVRHSGIPKKYLKKNLTNGGESSGPGF